MAKILFVDDYQVLRSTFTRILRSAGHDVTEAVNGEGGLAQVRTDRYDLVFTDVRMASMHGTEMVRRMRAEGVMTPVLMWTGGALDQQPIVDQMLAEGTVAKVIEKPPADLAEFRQTLAEVLTPTPSP